VSGIPSCRGCVGHSALHPPVTVRVCLCHSLGGGDVAGPEPFAVRSLPALNVPLGRCSTLASGDALHCERRGLIRHVNVVSCLSRSLAWLVVATTSIVRHDVFASFHTVVPWILPALPHRSTLHTRARGAQRVVATLTRLDNPVSRHTHTRLMATLARPLLQSTRELLLWRYASIPPLALTHSLTHSLTPPPPPPLPPPLTHAPTHHRCVASILLAVHKIKTAQRR
jgi:hypothetical protein